MIKQRLKAARKAKKLTQEQLAKLLQTTKGTISNYENGYSTPSNEMLALLSEKLDVTSDYLLGRTDSSQPLSKEERDIAKRLESFRAEIENSDGLAFDGEPMSEEAKESLIESMEHIFRQTQRINKKYAPKKYREDE
ncbi:helix-turn-helix transcriptional regulator [Lysinibacillus sp. Bpr_S20]|uniref:helix-turn-helix domain-containing protein n=1 Tax=Lysinibacillus sp. Bpr_S20 TaxID=2933964 RepID=UPI0020123F3D|nr:helix-turn-helix transcriptional regulator [Lysinibacillus sp. Bpr_S20]MCL1701585.1 helix-turn-helix domain-containing protein [Lysinibacillus sp. Bpr_S20]